jgi:hypothetical protein
MNKHLRTFYTKYHLSFEASMKKVELLRQVDEYGLEVTSNAKCALDVFQLGQMIQRVAMNGHKRQVAQASFLSTN